MSSTVERPIRVVVVDDDPLIVRFVVRALRSFGADARGLDSPFGVTNAVEDHRANVVVLDLSMPGLDGMGLYDAICERVTTPPAVVFHTGADESALALLRARYPLAAVVQKPVAMQALWTAVRSVHARATRKSARADDR
jgi:FixJ family two-component response regulator